jgi:cytochrome c oxidase subunit 1
MAIDAGAKLDEGAVPPPLDRPGGRRRGYWTSPNIVTGLVGGVAGYAFGHWLGNLISSSYAVVQNSGSSDVAILLGYIFATLGWLAGLGIFNYPLAKMAGIQSNVEPLPRPGLGRYFSYTLDHKVVGIQYLVGMLLYFCTAGIEAMGIRTELLSPTSHLIRPDTYLTIVGEHGTMMMMMMTSVVVGPFANYFLPLMLGSKRMAFPRLEALSFWLTPAAYVILLSGYFLGGFQTGWTGYAPLSIQTAAGQDSYLMAFGLMAFSMIVNAVNLITTVVNYRAPGMRFSRMPAFVWATLTTAFLFALAAPVLAAGLYMMGMDRGAQTAFFSPLHGGSSYLWENVFWFFGHPEVYILAVPGFGLVAEILPVFTRKPLFGYRILIAGMIGVSVLSFFVWQHHLFMSGMNPDMRPVVMLTTEMISVPTGFVFFAAMGTVWRGKMRLEVPMLFALAMYFNFLIGGISGVFLSDVPADVTAHGSFFVMAHFHYTIMGGLIFAFFGAMYYWLPKMTGRMLNPTLGKIQFGLMFVAFNSTFLPLFAVGELGQPRRVFEYARFLQTLNDWVSISAFVLGFAVLLFIVNLVYSLVLKPVPAPANPWSAKGLEWQLPSPPPRENFVHIPIIRNWPYDYGVPDAPPVAAPAALMAATEPTAVGGEPLT